MACPEQVLVQPLPDIPLNDDWVSLMLTDAGLDAIPVADSDVCFSCFDDLPLPDTDFGWSMPGNDMFDSDLMVTGDRFRVDSDTVAGDEGVSQGPLCSPGGERFSQFIDHLSCFAEPPADIHTCQGNDAPKQVFSTHTCQHGDESKQSFFSHTCQRDVSPKMGVLSHDDASRKDSLSHSYQNDGASKKVVAGTIFEATNCASLSPESGITNGSSSSSHKDSDSGVHDKDSSIDDKYSSMPYVDSGSEEDDLYCFVSKICSEDSGSSDLGQGITSNGEKTMASHSPSPGNGGTSSSRKRKNIEQDAREAPRDYEGREGDEDEEKRRARLMRNRESAQLSRQRKKLYVDELQEKIKTMASTIAELNNTINLISAENINLRRQLGMFGPPPNGQSGGMPGLPPWMGSYHPSTIIGGNFMMPNSHVPVVAIPRWKSNTTLDPSKESKPKKGSTDKGSKRTRKAAGIASIGFLFFVFILFPMNFNMWVLKTNHRKLDTNPWAGNIEPGKALVRAGGRVLTGISENHISTVFDEHDSDWNLAENNGKNSPARKIQEKGDKAPSSGSTYLENGSVPLAATLFVPRHDGLVRIEGNLIIHSILASNEATTEKENRTTRMSIPSYDDVLALDVNLKAIALKAAPKEKGALVELQRALAKKSRLNSEEAGLQSLQEDGSFPQWFIEDLSGPVFSSGMCTEVFQFETSPSSATSTQRTNIDDEQIEDKGKFKKHAAREEAISRSGLHSRKTASYAVPLPPIGHKAILKGGLKERNIRNSKDGCSSSVVVSVLAESEFGEQAKSIAGRKGPSKIFVVVLIDNVKYITYSCKLPSSISQPQYEVVVA